MNTIITSKAGLFRLVEQEGIGVNDTPYRQLKVESNGDAEKHVLEVRLHYGNMPAYDGQPVQYKYYADSYVANGMRGTKNSLAETRELIAALEDAVDFAESVDKWLLEHDEWLYS